MTVKVYIKICNTISRLCTLDNEHARTYSVAPKIWYNVLHAP